MNPRPILYLAGPMTGLPEFNRLSFHAAAAKLRTAGYLVVNPAENGLLTDAPWISHMRKDLADMVSTCDAVATWLEFARTAREAEALMG